MVSVILSWLYISLVCILVGVALLGIVKKTRFSLTSYWMAGMTAITVYAEAVSIFAPIGAVAHIVLLIAALFAGGVKRETLRGLYHEYRPIVCSWEGFFYGCILLFLAFFASRGIFHTDTNIYHAQAIRLYEEYGMLKGAGNLQLHFAYNSAYLAFASVFSLRWLFGQSLHTTTGLLELVLCLYAFHGLKGFWRHESHIADLMKAGLLFYVLVILTGSMSPATDYATMLYVIYIITAWCENMEGDKSVALYSLLSVAAVFAMTLKFSSCMLVLLAVYPALYLIKGKRWKEIAAYLLCGIVAVTPFFIRNYYISGWLLYPFEGIDIFRVEWKIPKEYLLVDANQIKVWGRCLYDVGKTDWPVWKWFPVWWEAQERYAQMFLGAVVLGAILQAVVAVHSFLIRRKIRADLAVLIVVIWINLAIWFLTAPFIRYGLGFLFAVIMIAVGTCISEKRRGFYNILTGGFLFCILVSVSPYWDNYITDAGVFFKHSVKEPYYLLQKDYDEGDMVSVDLGGNTVWYAGEYEINSYHVYPGTCYQGMLERSTLIGDTIEDGFKAK